MLVDEGSDQNLDFKPRYKRQHMRLLDALAHMRLLLKSRALAHLF